MWETEVFPVILTKFLFNLVSRCCSCAWRLNDKTLRPWSVLLIAFVYTVHAISCHKGFINIQYKFVTITMWFCATSKVVQESTRVLWFSNKTSLETSLCLYLYHLSWHYIRVSSVFHPSSSPRLSIQEVDLRLCWVSASTTLPCQIECHTISWDINHTQTHRHRIINTIRTRNRKKEKKRYLYR